MNEGFDILNEVDRVSLLYSYLVDGDNLLEDRKSIYDVMMKTGSFDEFKGISSGEGFFSQDYFKSASVVVPPFKKVKLTYKDILAVYTKELEWRSKKKLSEKLVGVCDNLAGKSLEDMLAGVQDLVQVHRPPRKFESSIDGLAAYKKKKETPLGVLTGVKALDAVVQGLEYGTMCCVFGYVGQGKTTLMLNQLYQAITRGFNGVFVTLEVPRQLMYFALLSLHSYMMAAKTGDAPVSYLSILKGELTPAEEKLLFGKVEKSLLDLPGKCVFVDFDAIQDFTFHGLNHFCESLKWPVDLFILDYMQLLLLNMPKIAGYDRISDARVVRDFTNLAIGNSRFKAKIVILGAQANREGYNRSIENEGQYDLMAISDVNQLERDAYYCISLFVDDELRQSGETKMCLLKNKSGPIITMPVVVPMDPRFYAIGDNIKGYAEPVTVKDVNDVLTGFNLSDVTGGGL